MALGPGIYIDQLIIVFAFHHIVLLTLHAASDQLSKYSISHQHVTQTPNNDPKSHFKKKILNETFKNKFLT